MTLRELLEHRPALCSALPIRVTPKASRNAITIKPQENGEPQVRLYITTAPEDGKANLAVIALLAKELNIAKSSITIVRGKINRNKVIRIK